MRVLRALTLIPVVPLYAAGLVLATVLCAAGLVLLALGSACAWVASSAVDAL